MLNLCITVTNFSKINIELFFHLVNVSLRNYKMILTISDIVCSYFLR